MRIIAGKYRSRVLRAPKGGGTRPTTDRVRESLMSSLVSMRGGLDGAVVLDAFAGSGALGLETLSRGAATARFYERDGAAFRTLQENVRMLGLTSATARIVRSDILLNPPSRTDPPFDLVLLDPPYAYSAADVLGLVALLRERGALSSDALIVYEHAGASNDLVEEGAPSYGLALASRKKYGDTVVDVLKDREGTTTP